MMIVFFDIRSVIMIEWVPECQTVDQKYNLEVLTELQELVRKKRPELWNNESWILHQDNAPAHNALTVNQFLADKCIPVLEHPSYSLDLAPCDFYLLPEVKSALKEAHSQSVDEVKSKTADLLNRVSADDLQHCFQQWKIRV
jgi:hypothetical protein